MTKKNLLKKCMALFLTSVCVTMMTLGVSSTTSGNLNNVLAAEDTTTGVISEKTIAGLGTSVMVAPKIPEDSNSSWEGSYVYFGSYEGSPVKYRVLDKNSIDFGSADRPTMLLDCDTGLWEIKNHLYIGNPNPEDIHNPIWMNSSDWNESELKSVLNGDFLLNNFTSLEQSAIAASVKAEPSASDYNSTHPYTPLTGEKIFSLEFRDVYNNSYGYRYSLPTRKTDKDGNYIDYPLRSIVHEYRLDAAHCTISKSGNIALRVKEISPSAYVSPAMNIDHSAILFSSAVKGTAGEYGTEYKLTILDKDMIIAGNGDVTRKNNVITIPYTLSGTNMDKATNISVLILENAYNEKDKDNAVVKYYGSLDTTNTTGAGTFTLPDEFADKECGKDYYVYILAEDINGEKETDYASNLVEIKIPKNVPEVSDTPEVPNPAPDTKIEYDILDGANNSWETNSDGSLSVRGSGEFSKFVGVKVNGVLVDDKNYTVTEGSTIITFRKEYLNTLPAGDYTIEIMWTDGSASTEFTVENQKNEAPMTGDTTNVILFLMLSLLSGLCIIGTSAVKKSIR